MQKVPGVCLCCVNAKHGPGSFRVWSRGTIFPGRCGTKGKCYDCMAETLNVYFNSFLCLRKSLHSTANLSRYWVGFLRIHHQAESLQSLCWFQTWVGGNKQAQKPKQKKHFFFIQILEERREATCWSPKLSSSTPSPGFFNPFLLNSTSSIQMSVIITAAQQTSSLNYNILPAQCAKSTSLSLSLFPHQSSDFSAFKYPLVLSTHSLCNAIYFCNTSLQQGKCERRWGQ